MEDADFERLCDFVRDRRGVDLSGYRPQGLRRRVQKRMSDVGVDHYGEYLDRLASSSDEVDELFDAVFINLSRFFRDSESWYVLQDSIIPELVAGEERIRIWCPGSATGEEVYSVRPPGRRAIRRPADPAGAS